MTDDRKVIRLNVGCGDIPTLGWSNYDNSFTVRFARWPRLSALMSRLGLLSPKQMRFISVVRRHNIRYANAVKRIPEASASVEVLYTCHMLEHLDRQEAEQFLREARRVLAPNGIIRIAVPDLRIHVEAYLKNGDADTFVENMYMAPLRTDSFIQKLRYLLVGDRQHLWMYDGKSLCELLTKIGFKNPRVLSAGETTIPNPGELDLAERAEESLFVEAVNP
jgi:SAM-dependent methyltransferase